MTGCMAKVGVCLLASDIIWSAICDSSGCLSMDRVIVAGLAASVLDSVAAVTTVEQQKTVL